MTRRSVLGPVLAVAALVPVPPATHAQTTDPVRCQREIIVRLEQLKKTHLKYTLKCLDGVNLGKIPGPCPDAVAAAKLAVLALKVRDKIALRCSMTDLTTTLGFRNDCDYGPGTSSADGACVAMPVTTPAEFADCLMCWKTARFNEYMAILYASHAIETCGGALDAGSTECAALDCATPLPDQRDLGDTSENDCQRQLGKAGINYLLKRERLLEKLAIKGFDQATALPLVGVKLAQLEEKMRVTMQKSCGVHEPQPSPPFCCRTTGNMCVAAASREDCEQNLGGNVQEDKTCNAGQCDPTPGNKKITWWGVCPEDDTCSSALTTQEDMIECIADSADTIVDRLICLQVPRNGGLDWPCP